MAFPTIRRPFEDYSYVPSSAAPRAGAAAPSTPPMTRAVTPAITQQVLGNPVLPTQRAPTPDVYNAVATGGPMPQLAAPPAAAPPATTNFGGYQGDPGVAQAGAAENLGLAQLKTSLDEARRQAIIRWGDPALAGLAGFGLDPQAGTFAKQNYLSGNADLARLDKAKQDRRNAIINRLASHGIVGSGDLGYYEGQNNTQYGQERYDAQNKYLDYFRQLIEQYLSGSQQLRQTETDAYTAAYNKYLQNPGIYYSGA